MSIELTFLGTGTSQGIPMIGCNCSVCRSSDPRDRRLRCSVLLQWDAHQVLIDATPELRLQCLASEVRHLDAVLITHAHADHIFGMDDLRRFNQMQHKPIDIFAAPDHLAVLERVFGYARVDRSGHNPDLPHLLFHAIEQPFSLFGHDIVPLPLEHGRTRTLGFRVGPLAYCTDLSAMPEETFARLAGVEVLVLGALRLESHPAHLSIEQAVALSQRLGVRQTYLTHLSHHVRHEIVEKTLPSSIRLAYDGLKVVVG